MMHQLLGLLILLAAFGFIFFAYRQGMKTKRHDRRRNEADSDSWFMGS
jgi:hypothetical protein